MKLPLKVKFNNGEEITYVVSPPDFRRWELKTGKTVRQAGEIGMNDMMTLAHLCLVRESTGNKPVKPFEAWCDTIDDIELGEIADPKVIQSEALAE